MDNVPSESVDLIVTSPPYPMIQMWDEMFCKQNPSVEPALKKAEGSAAFELMHKILDPVWNEVFRVLKYGGLACINIGDATRTINGTSSACWPLAVTITKADPIKRASKHTDPEFWRIRMM